VCVIVTWVEAIHYGYDVGVWVWVVGVVVRQSYLRCTHTKCEAMQSRGRVMDMFRSTCARNLVDVSTLSILSICRGFSVHENEAPVAPWIETPSESILQLFNHSMRIATQVLPGSCQVTGLEIP
jgi:hypothetical protein